MKTQILFLVCYIVSQQVTGQQQQDYLTDGNITLESLDDFDYFYLQNYISAEIQQYEEQELEQASLSHFINKQLSLKSGIIVFTPEHIPSSSVSVNWALKSLQFSTHFNSLYLIIPQGTATEFTRSTFSELTIKLEGIIVSGIAGIKMPGIVTDMYLSYNTSLGHVEGGYENYDGENELLSGVLKPYLDSLIRTKLNENLKNHSYLAVTSSRSLPVVLSSELSGNEIVDGLLTVVSKNVPNRIDIPDLDFEFKHGYIRTTNGWFEGLTSIHRLSNVTLTENDETYQLSSSLGLQQVKVGFNYKAKYSIFKVHGSAVGDVGYNSVFIQVSLDTSNGACSVVLNDLKVQQMDNLKIKLTGFGPFNGLVSKIATKQLNKYKGKIISKLESSLSSYLQKYASNFDCDNLLGM